MNEFISYMLFLFPGIWIRTNVLVICPALLTLPSHSSCLKCSRLSRSPTHSKFRICLCLPIVSHCLSALHCTRCCSLCVHYISMWSHFFRFLLRISCSCSDVIDFKLYIRTCKTTDSYTFDNSKLQLL